MELVSTPGAKLSRQTVRTTQVYEEAVQIIFPGPELSAADTVATPLLALVLAWLVVVDLREFRLPDRGTLPLLVLGLALAFWRAGGALPWPELAGAATGYAVFWGIGAAFWRLRGREGLGHGDAKLIAAGGAWVGIGLLPLVVLAAASSALIFVLVSGHNRADGVPFGPWLACGIGVGWAVRLFGG